jgi:hypothetical protein
MNASVPEKPDEKTTMTPQGLSTSYLGAVYTYDSANKLPYNFRVQFPAKGGLLLNLGSIFPEMCLQMVVMGV